MSEEESKIEPVVIDAVLVKAGYKNNNMYWPSMEPLVPRFPERIYAYSYITNVLIFF